MTSLLVDGNGLACRLWWAMPHETAHRFTATVGSVAYTHGVTSTTVCWDSKGPTWRHEVMPRYKANRPKKPDALIVAIQACRHTSFLHLEAAGYEADDVIATLARRNRGVAEGKLLVLTDDKDMAQLVGPPARVLLVNAKGELSGIREVRERWGVPPNCIRNFLSWAGDSADGLPGVRGVGPKRALPRALAGEVGDQLTYDLCGLADVPEGELVSWGNAMKVEGA